MESSLVMAASRLLLALRLMGRETLNRAKRLECVELAPALEWWSPYEKREQAPRTPNASRNSGSIRHAGFAPFVRRGLSSSGLLRRRLKTGLGLFFCGFQVSSGTAARSPRHRNLRIPFQGFHRLAQESHGLAHIRRQESVQRIHLLHQRFS